MPRLFPSVYFLLAISSILLHIAAVPIQQDVHHQLSDISAPISTIPPVAHSSPLPKNPHPIAARAKSQKKPKTPSTPATPTTPQPNNPPQTKPKKKRPSGVPVPSEAQIRKKCKVPRDKAIFWSGTGETLPYDYAARNNLITDVLSYPNGYVKLFKEGKHKNVAKDNEFMARYSRVFAQSASGTVHVMVPWAAGPDRKRYFHKYEWPVIKKSMKSGRITKVIQINPNDTSQTRAYNPKKDYGFAKRDADVDLNDAPWDVDLDALHEAWKRDNSVDDLV